MMDRTEILTKKVDVKLVAPEARVPRDGMRAGNDEIVGDAEKREREPQRMMGDLLSAELNEKLARSIKYHMTVALMPFANEVEKFDFPDTPVSETLVRDLASRAFLEQQLKLTLVGGMGAGKTHLPAGIARACIRAGAPGRFFKVVEMVEKLDAETRDGCQGRTADLLSWFDFLMPDELGCLPFA